MHFFSARVLCLATVTVAASEEQEIKVFLPQQSGTLTVYHPETSNPPSQFPNELILHEGKISSYLCRVWIFIFSPLLASSAFSVHITVVKIH